MKELSEREEHLLEVLRWHFEGKRLEFKDSIGNWSITYNHYTEQFIKSIMENGKTYRVKPEPELERIPLFELVGKAVKIRACSAKRCFTTICEQDGDTVYLNGANIPEHSFYSDFLYYDTETKEWRKPYREVAR